jgi:hypothetical protein
MDTITGSPYMLPSDGFVTTGYMVEVAGLDGNRFYYLFHIWDQEKQIKESRE